MLAQEMANLFAANSMAHVDAGIGSLTCPSFSLATMLIFPVVHVQTEISVTAIYIVVFGGIREGESARQIAQDQVISRSSCACIR